MSGVATVGTGQRLTELEAHAFKTSVDVAYIKETLNDLPKIVREEIMTYTAPMFEEIMNRMATKEDLSALSTKVDDLETKVDNLDLKVGNLETKVDNLDLKVGNLETKVDNLDLKVGNLETKVDNLEAKMDARMDSFEGRMNSFEGRMNSMEGKMDQILAKLG